jgi:hypothetical protein
VEHDRYVVFPAKLPRDALDSSRRAAVPDLVTLTRRIAMTAAERHGSSLSSDLLLYLGAVLLMLGLGTLIFDPKHHPSSSSTAGIVITTLGAIAILAVAARRRGG